ncbi:hypothetical protein [Nocardioides sp.]|uniref:hypothetical protein n=1 Tax=Nocardioides sp. TaxID=35761 RepID=UPI003518F236
MTARPSVLPRRARFAALTATAALVFLGGCSGQDDGADAAPADPTVPTASEPAAPVPTAPGSPAPDAPAGDPLPCPEVRAGIDAFNAGDLDETVARFVAAVPLAEEAYAADPSPALEALLDAVRYYAALPAEQYLAASAGSPEFQVHKATTLTLCRYQGPPAGEGDDGTVTA